MKNSNNSFINFFSTKKNLYSVIMIIFILSSVYLFNVYYGRLNNKITVIESGVHITNLSKDKELFITYENNGEGLKVYNLFYNSLLIKYPGIVISPNLLYDDNTNKLWLGYWDDFSLNEKRFVINYINVNDFQFATNNYVSQSLEFKDKPIFIDSGKAGDLRYIVNDPDFNFLIVFTLSQIHYVNLLDSTVDTVFCSRCFNFFSNDPTFELLKSPNNSPIVLIDEFLFWAQDSILYRLRILPNTITNAIAVYDFGGNESKEIKYLTSNGDELLIFLSNLDVYGYKIIDNTSDYLININSINNNISEWKLSNKYIYTGQAKNVVLTNHHSNSGNQYINGFSWEVDILQNLNWTALNIVYPSNNPDFDIVDDEVMDFLTSDNGFKMQTNTIIFSENQKIYSIDLETMIIVEQSNNLFTKVPPFTDWLIIGLSLSLITISILELRSRIILKKKNQSNRD